MSEDVSSVISKVNGGMISSFFIVRYKDNRQ
jgi:hypothetical protein